MGGRGGGRMPRIPLETSSFFPLAIIITGSAILKLIVMKVMKVVMMFMILFMMKLIMMMTLRVLIKMIHKWHNYDDGDNCIMWLVSC